MNEELIHESHRSKIFLVTEEKGGDPIVLKVLNNDFPSPSDIAQLYNEPSVLEGLELTGVRKIIGRTKVKNKHALKMEYFNGISLKKAFVDKQNDVLDFLYIAIEICKTLDEVHAAGVTHKDISPSNILVQLQERKINIIDFEFSSRTVSKSYDLSNPTNLVGTISYCSPEQTGRINRAVDHRSDLYSLGATFYELLATQPPFIGKDAMELVHFHIAHAPKPLHELNANVPIALSKVIGTLLEKNAEDRYQSARGLQRDLEICLDQYSQTASIESFEIGRHDFWGEFSIPEKLYGRDQEISKILSIFERCAAGEPELLLVNGYSGTGKTVLVHEVHKPITLARGFYVEGKYDQFQKSIPYSGILQAIVNLIDLVLLEDEQTINRISSRVSQALGEEGQVLTNLVPNLELLIGPQRELPELTGEDSRRRFDYVFGKFFAAFCDADHPIVLFLDDVQWADAASFQLIQNLLTAREVTNILCICAYRSNEVPQGHALHATIAGLNSAGVSLSNIDIGNLSDADIGQLVADAVAYEPSSTPIVELTNLIIEKTQGNAFFTTQFLKSIEENGDVYYERNSNQWKWDLEKIRAKNLTDNVIEFLTAKIRLLPVSTQYVLKTAAALGSTVDMQMFDIIYSGTEQARAEEFDRAIHEGLMFKLSTGQFKFAHDRVMEAVYSLLEPDEKAHLHKKIAQLLEENSDEQEIESRLFEIVNHFNFAMDNGCVFADLDNHHAKLNYRAAVKAKGNSAFQLSLDYLLRAKKLLSADSWEDTYALTYEIHKEITEVSYLCANYEVTDEHFAIVDEKAESVMDRVKVYEVKINSFKALNDLPSAIDLGLEALRLLGRKIPRHPSKARVMASILKTEARLRGTSNNSILALPSMEDPKHIAAMRIMANIAPSAYWAEPNIIPILSSEMIGMSLKHGLNETSAFCFAGYGIIMCGVLGSMRRGKAYGELGLKLLEQFDSKEWVTQIVDPVYALIVHWNEHVDKSLAPLRNSFYTGLETGENEFACVNANIYCIHAFLSGKPLDLLEKETAAFSNSFFNLKQGTQHHYNEIYRQGMRCLMGLDDDPHRLIGEAFDAEAMLPIKQEKEDKSAVFFIYFNTMMISYFFGDFKQALQQADLALELEEAVLSKFEIPNLYFYRALSALALALDEDSKKLKSAYLKVARKAAKKLTYFAKYSPENYLHKATLLKSQIALLEHHLGESRVLVDMAISQAGKQKFIHEEALAFELGARAYIRFGMDDLGKYYLNNAFNLYQQWGARAKLDQLLKFYPQYLSEVRAPKNHSNFHSGSHTSSSISGLHLDVDTIIKASLTLSSEVELPKLLSNLLSMVIENAGAQKGALILLRDDKLCLEAVSDISTNLTENLLNLPIEAQPYVPPSIAKYVARARRNFISNSFANLTEFTRDEYVARVKPESMLSVPIINQGNLLGVVYLENNLTKNAFTPERVELLSVLSSQMAVSINNALLYENLEQKVAERTVELAKEKKKSDVLLANILPKAVALELKEKGTTEPMHFEAVTVLFADFVGFTSASTKMTTKQLVDTLNSCFKSFDEICEDRRLEKIKTIGDSYMCAGGLPIANSTHAFDAIEAAFDIVKSMEEFNAQSELNGIPRLEVRIGIHTGPLVAGVVGTTKFAYDIWGNTVNKASHLESSSEQGKINISEETYQIVKDKFACTFRGSKMAKNLGKVNMYFVTDKAIS